MHHTLFPFPLAQEVYVKTSVMCFFVFWSYECATSDSECESVLSLQKLLTKLGVAAKKTPFLSFICMCVVHLDCDSFSEVDIEKNT